MSLEKPIKYLARNIETGDYIADLGMSGEYPFSSCLGREVCIDGVTTEYWYPTEINPVGKTQVEHDTEMWINKINPTIALSESWYGQRMLKVNYIGEGLIVPKDVNLQGIAYVWREKTGFDPATPECVVNMVNDWLAKKFVMSVV